MGRMLEPEFVGRTYDDFLFRPQASPLALAARGLAAERA